MLPRSSYSNPSTSSTLAHNISRSAIASSFEEELPSKLTGPASGNLSWICSKISCISPCSRPCLRHARSWARFLTSTLMDESLDQIHSHLNDKFYNTSIPSTIRIDYRGKKMELNWITGECRKTQPQGEVLLLFHKKHLLLNAVKCWSHLASCSNPLPNPFTIELRKTRNPADFGD